ncbi:Secreted RxLR effector peptide protein [Phytophthora palmivora]|uniref:RxLR effector protein n=1 Tax=Phytophthora palmivora TaxID=4796 RepID=A0A2P4Y5V7_9STRA|nr:Secreted RxLR effector peptide protein [Phytophthora palmivora]
MRLAKILLAAIMTLSVHQVSVAASVGSDVTLTGVMSLGFLHLVGADQSVSDQFRFVRGNNIAEGGKEERGFAKDLVSKMLRTESFSSLEKVNDLVTLKTISAEVDEHLKSVFKFADEKKMNPSALATQLKTIHGADDAITKKAVDMYTSYLKSLGKYVD